MIMMVTGSAHYTQNVTRNMKKMMLTQISSKEESGRRDKQETEGVRRQIAVKMTTVTNKQHKRSMLEFSPVMMLESLGHRTLTMLMLAAR